VPLWRKKPDAAQIAAASDLAAYATERGLPLGEAHWFEVAKHIGVYTRDYFSFDRLTVANPDAYGASMINFTPKTAEAPMGAQSAQTAETTSILHRFITSLWTYTSLVETAHLKRPTEIWGSSNPQMTAVVIEQFGFENFGDNPADVTVPYEIMRDRVLSERIIALDALLVARTMS